MKDSQITEHYICPKCRNRHASVKRVHLPQSSLPDLLGILGGKYIFLTCTLCGYTEIFDQAIYLQHLEDVEIEAEAAIKNPEKGIT